MERTIWVVKMAQNFKKGVALIKMAQNSKNASPSYKYWKWEKRLSVVKWLKLVKTRSTHKKKTAQKGKNDLLSQKWLNTRRTGRVHSNNKDKSHLQRWLKMVKNQKLLKQPERWSCWYTLDQKWYNRLHV